jgi:hypothetical protein
MHQDTYKLPNINTTTQFVKHAECVQQRQIVTLATEDGDLLLLKVPTVLLIHKNQVQVVPRRELHIDY